MNEQHFFRESKTWWRVGYFIPVRSSMSYHLKQRHISAELKEVYQKTFGTKILLDTEFEAWYAQAIQAQKAAKNKTADP